MKSRTLRCLTVSTVVLAAGWGWVILNMEPQAPPRPVSRLIANEPRIAERRQAELNDHGTAAERSGIAKRERDFYFRKGDAAMDNDSFEDALAEFQKALALTVKDKEPKEWTRIATIVAALHVRLSAYKEAEPLYLEMLRLSELHYGPAARKTIDSLDRLAQYFRRTQQLGEAVPLMRRALVIEETSLHKHAPELFDRLNELRSLLVETKRFTEAEPFARQTVEICAFLTSAVGTPVNRIEDAIKNYESILLELGDTKEQAEGKVAKLLESIPDPDEEAAK